MKHPVTAFKNLKKGLKEIERFIRDGTYIETGKPINNFGKLRPREIVGNWLLCAVLNFESQADWKTCTDPQGGDGILYNVTLRKVQFMEHVLVSINNKTKKNIEDLILDQISKKNSKGGKSYARGKSLVVFINKEGNNLWTPNNIVKKLPSPIYFNSIWLIGLAPPINDGYIYNVVYLHMTGCLIWSIQIKKDFINWNVEIIQ